MAHTLYRMFDRDGVLLYVGISKRPMTRFDEHGRDKSWWQDVDRITVEHFPSRSALELAERDAVRVEQPLHNVQRYGGLPPALAVDADRLERLWEQVEQFSAATGMGMASTFGLLRRGHLDKAEARLAEHREFYRRHRPGETIEQAAHRLAMSAPAPDPAALRAHLDALAPLIHAAYKAGTTC